MLCGDCSVRQSLLMLKVERSKKKVKRQNDSITHGSSCSAQMSNEPIARQQSRTFIHVDVVRTAHSISNQAG